MKKKQFVNLINLPVIAMTLSAGTALAGTPAPMTSVVDTPDWLKVSGYAAVAYTYTDVDSDFTPANTGGLLADQNGDNDTFFDAGTPIDAVKVGFEATQGPFTAYASLFWSPDGDAANTNAFGPGGDVGILDAYVTYKTGDFSITGGKYISWLGYEAFDAVNMTQLTYANSGLGSVPGYHTGIKFEYTTDIIAAGFNVSDSIRGGDSFWGGDEDYSNGLGYEAYVVYKGIDKLTLWGGVAFDDTDDAEDLSVYDVWASYDVSDKLTIAAELIFSENTTDGGPVGTAFSDPVTGFGLPLYQQGFQGLLFAKYTFTEKFSTVFRFGFDDVDYDDAGINVSSSGYQNFKYTIAPSYIINEHLTLRGELSYTDNSYDLDGDDFDNDVLFAGVQALLKF